MSSYNSLTAWVIAIGGTVIEFVQGNSHNAIFILLCMMILDFITGILKGIKNRRLKSAVMHFGIIKKAGIMASIILGYLLDQLLSDGMPVFSTLLIWAGIANEGLSNLENLKAIGVKIPNVITSRLSTILKDVDQLQDEKDLKNIK